MPSEKVQDSCQYSSQHLGARFWVEKWWEMGGVTLTCKIFLTHYLVLSPDLLYVDTVVLGLLLCLYIHTCNAL